MTQGREEGGGQTLGGTESYWRKWTKGKETVYEKGTSPN